MDEASMHQKNCFITLTYRDDALIYGNELATLFPRHLTLFFKKFRKKFGAGIRFFACGEYGDLSNRPHYHACIFGHQFDDLELVSIKDGIKLYTSPTLKTLWGHGHVTIGEVTFESAAYVARYIMKKKLGKEKNYYEENSLIPEFTRMSRRPGIGSSYYDKFKGDMFPHDYVVIRNGQKVKPPKFYLQKYTVENPINSEILKNKRKKHAENNTDNKSLPRLKVKKQIKINKITQLKRTI